MKLFSEKLWQQYQLKKLVQPDVAVAFDASHNRPVVIRSTPVPSTDDLPTFQQSARRRLALKHPNIAELYDVLSLDKRLYWVMEFCDNGTLAEFLNGNHGVLPISEVIDVGAALINGLMAAHQHGISGANLSPEHLLLHTTPSGITVKISSFANIPLDIDGEDFVNTAPEQLEGHPVTPATDVYRLGILLFSLLTGTHYLPETQDDDTRFWHILAGEPMSPKSLRPETPDWLNSLVLAMLEKNPERRPHTTTVHQSLLHRTAPQHQPPTTQRHAKVMDKRLLWLGVGLTSVVLPALLSLILAWGYIQLTTANASPVANSDATTLTTVSTESNAVNEITAAPKGIRAAVQNSNIYDGLKVRTSPDRDAAIIDVLSDGDIVQIVEYNSDKSWARIITPTHQQGWVYVGQYLRISQ